MREIIERVGSAQRPAVEDLARLIGLEKPEEIAELRESANRIKAQTVGRVVYFRGLIEFSNVCARNCHYCGIRLGNRKVRRYTMPVEEIVEVARWAHLQQYGSIVLQSGERRSRQFVRFVEDLLGRINAATNGGLGVTLSLGEQAPETYRRWFQAGAHRYLLRIETSNPALFRALHPPSVTFEARKRCLGLLREQGYQVGTGVMIGLPGQTLEDLARDILFFKELDVDMIGMGPYIAHEATPLAAAENAFPESRRLEMALNMIAATRLAMPDINIAAATALQALTPTGRELGVLAGANVVMPNLTPVKYRQDYLLYPGKPCLDEDAEKCRHCLRGRIERLGEEVGFGRRGDSRHFVGRTAGKAGRE